MFITWRKLRQFSARKGWGSGWDFAIARNLLVDRVGKKPARHPFPFECATMDVARSSLGQIQLRQERSDIENVLDQLPFEQMEIIQLSFVHGLTQSEIATRLSLPLGTVKSRMRGAFEKLRFSTERET